MEHLSIWQGCWSKGPLIHDCLPWTQNVWVHPCRTSALRPRVFMFSTDQQTFFLFLGQIPLRGCVTHSFHLPTEHQQGHRAILSIHFSRILSAKPCTSACSTARGAPSGSCEVCWCHSRGMVFGVRNDLPKTHHVNFRENRHQKVFCQKSGRSLL